MLWNLNYKGVVVMLLESIKNIFAFIIDTFVGAVIEAIATPVTFALSVVKVGTVFAGSLV
jgi:hypothetical protein